jgi:outer membrane protein assembly factor BamA
MIRACAAALLLSVVSAAQDGVRPVLGGLPYDSGLALGVEYRKSRLAGSPIGARVKAIGSTKSYEFLEGALFAAPPVRTWIYAEIGARYRNYTEEDFWGIGHKSPPHLRSTYRQEDLNLTATVGLRPRRWLDFGFSGGLLRSNTGPGKDEDRPSIEEVFSGAMVPALDHQPHHLHTGAFVNVDYRDDTVDPRYGGFYQFRFIDFRTRGSGRFDFRRHEIDLRQAVPSPQKSATVLARASAIFSSTPAGHEVAFFQQPTVGGGGSLRGYHQYRFRDRNALLFNLEYRWRFREPFQAIAFADAGRVFSRPGQITLRGLRGSAGLGARMKFGESFVFGVDVGWSPDGLHAWFRGSHTF